MNTITAMPNQSIADIIVQGCGSMEAGIQFCIDNKLSMTDYPDVGTAYFVSTEALKIGDSAVLEYFDQKGVVIGTLGPVPSLTYSILLKPVMKVTTTSTTPLFVSGCYSYDLEANTAAFINVHAIAAGDYPSLHNVVQYETEDRVIAGFAPDTVAQNAGSLVMNNKRIPYRIPWIIFRGFMMIWSDLGAADTTATFVDIEGNRAYVSPMVVMDSATNTVVEYLIADLALDLVSATHNQVKLRLTRSHPGVAHIDFVNHTMSWLHDAVSGSPDPLDPLNPDKTIVTLSRGKYTFGVGTVYLNSPTTYPPSAFSMVVEVS